MRFIYNYFLFFLIVLTLSFQNTECEAQGKLFSANVLINGKAPLESVRNEELDVISDDQAIVFKNTSMKYRIEKRNIIGFQRIRESNPELPDDLTPIVEGENNHLRIAYLQSQASRAGISREPKTVSLLFPTHDAVSEAIRKLSQEVFHTDNRLEDMRVALAMTAQIIFEGRIDFNQELTSLLSAYAGLVTQVGNITTYNDAKLMGNQIASAAGSYSGVLVIGGDEILSGIVNGMDSRDSSSLSLPLMIIPTGSECSISSSLGVMDPWRGVLLALRALRNPDMRRRALSLVEYKAQAPQLQPQLLPIDYRGVALSGIRLVSTQAGVRPHDLFAEIKALECGAHSVVVRSIACNGDEVSYEAYPNNFSQCESIRRVDQKGFDGVGDFCYLAVMNVPDASEGLQLAPKLAPDSQEMHIVYLQRPRFRDPVRHWRYERMGTYREKTSHLSQEIKRIKGRKEVTLRSEDVGGNHDFYIDGHRLPSKIALVKVMTTDKLLTFLIIDERRRE